MSFDAILGEGYVQVTSSNPSIQVSELGPVLTDSAALDYTYEIQPEPSSIVLFTVGTLTLAAAGGFYRWRRERLEASCAA